ADSVTDYATFGTTSAGTATWSGIPVIAGGTISVTSALFAINNVSQPAGGTISLTTGTLTAVTGGFTFTGGMIDITNSSSTTLFQGSFTRRSVMVLKGARLNNTVCKKVSVTLQIEDGAVNGVTFGNAEPSLVA